MVVSTFAPTLPYQIDLNPLQPSGEGPQDILPPNGLLAGFYLFGSGGQHISTSTCTKHGAMLA